MVVHVSTQSLSLSSRRIPRERIRGGGKVMHTEIVKRKVQAWKWERVWRKGRTDARSTTSSGGENSRTFYLVRYSMECSRLNGTGCSERGVAFLSIIFDSARSLSEDLFSSSCLTIFQIYIYIYDLFYFALMHFAHIMKITSILATLRTSTIVTTRGACPRQREKKGNLSSLSLIDRQQSYTRTNIVFLCCAIPPRPHTFPPPPFPP